MRLSASVQHYAALSLLAATLTGCGGCEPPPPPPAPPPVQGVAPERPAAAPAQTKAAPAGDQHACGILVFTNVDNGPAPLQAQLTAEGDCTIGTARIQWDFGDGSPAATGESVVHTFEKAGTYSVRGRITSDALAGVEDSDDVEIVVTAPQG